MADLAKHIIVSGCTKGIGYAVCEHFASKGFNVAGCARSENDLAEMQKRFEQKFPSQRFLFMVCDMSVPAAVKAFGEAVLRSFHRVDVLVNNAGVFMPGHIMSEEDGVLEKQFFTNVASAYHLTRTVLPSMMKNPPASVFNMCSVASIRAYENGGSYCISKFALLGFSKQLREEMKPHGIKVTALIVGATLTDSWKGTELPESRFIEAADIAKTIWGIYDLSLHTDVEEIVIRPQLGDI